MTMVNMALPQENEAVETASNPYGYGLCIRLNPAQCEALGISATPSAGTTMGIKAIAIATCVTEEVDVGGEGEKEVYLELQITDMEVTAGAGGNSKSASMLYGGADAD